jgi:hypothetical protein
MGHTAKIEIDDKMRELPILEATEHERSLDISTLRASTGCITLNHDVPMEDRAGETR